MCYPELLTSMPLTTAQYFGVDPDLHTRAGLTDEITSTLGIWCEHSAPQERITTWLRYMSNHDDQAIFDIARQIVIELRGPRTGSVAIEVNLAISGNLLPSFIDMKVLP